MEKYEMCGWFSLLYSIVKNVDVDTATKTIYDFKNSYKKAGKPTKYAKYEDKFIKEMDSKGIKNEEIGKRLGFTSLQIRNRKCYLKRMGYWENL